MSKPFPVHPTHPERICWGCDRYCPTSSMACGNGSTRTMHPVETLGDDWYLDYGFELPAKPVKPATVERATCLIPAQCLDG